MFNKNTTSFTVIFKSPHELLSAMELQSFVSAMMRRIFPSTLINGKPISYFERFSAKANGKAITVSIVECRMAPWRRILFAPSMLLRGMPPHGFVIARHGFLSRSVVSVCRELGWSEIGR